MSSGAAHPEIDRSAPTLTGIQRLVHDVLDGVIAHMGRVLESEVPFVNEVNFHLQQMRGKLFRPVLLALANRVEDTPDDREIALGAVIEIIHLATLVHDDSIDESELRRGLPTVNHKWDHKVSVIMGDYLYSRAMDEITRLGDLTLIGLAARVTNDMTVGEMVEIAHHRRMVDEMGRYFFLIEKKTASLIATACEMGAVVGAPHHRQALREYGHRLGMAFQLIDDLMDYGGRSDVMGKPSGADLREGQITFPLLAVLPTLGAAERRLVQGVIESGSPPPGAIEEILALVGERGGLSATRKMAERYAEHAREALERLPPTAARDVLDAAIDYVLARDR